MPRLKRSAAEAELDNGPLDPTVHMAEDQLDLLTKLRNTWEFASFMQYIFLFGHAVKIDDNFDVEDLEAECLMPTPSERLAQIGLTLLKYVSSHRGLTLEIFDEYTRRQYLAKAPQRNPFGDDEEPKKFEEMDIFTRLRVLHQLSTWTFGNVDRMRSLMPEDEDHLNWRIEPIGWDREDRSYYVLDDNRLYRRTDEIPPPPSPKAKPKPKPKPKAKAKPKTPIKPRTKGTRSSKRIKVMESEDEEDIEDEQEEEKIDDEDETMIDVHEQPAADEEPGYGFTSKTWECIAVTLEEYQDFMATIFRSRDPNEKALRARLEEDVIPIIEKRAEAIRQKQLKKIRELENLQKMATAKRSSRLADKADREKQEKEEREAEEKRRRELEMAYKEQERQRKIEEGHESRRLTREQRLREREAKRILHEEELAKIEEEEQRAASQGLEGDSDASKRISERRLNSQREQHKKELEKLAEEDDKWIFDCSVCGMHGENIDDGTHSIACDKCNVWQHSKCHGFSPKQAESEDFTFVCATCKRKEEEALKPKIPPLKLVKSQPSEDSIAVTVSARPHATINGSAKLASSINDGLPDHVKRQLAEMDAPQQDVKPPSIGQINNGPSLSPQGQHQGPPGYQRAGYVHIPYSAPQQAWMGNALPPPPLANGTSATSSAQLSHQQQHRQAHVAATASAGAHAGYHAPYSQQQQQQQQYTPHRPHTNVNGSHHPAPNASYQQPPFAPSYGNQQVPQPTNRISPQQQYRPAPTMASSPVKLPPSSPPQPLQPYSTPQARPPSFQQQIQASPKTSFPPPVSDQNHQTSSSPVKSSPVASSMSQQQHAYYRASPQQHPPSLGMAPQHAVQPVNGHQPTISSTPTPQSRPVVVTKDTNDIAADGMAGPWPEGSKAIPQKHDQGSAPAPLPH